MSRRGFNRYAALRKPPISEQNRKARLVFARNHINKTYEQNNGDISIGLMRLG
ncbi:hypothetical protein IMZ48_30465 [Candidatus Bathyarchaeota archaeon]|nr:hypothetical protein [Candidatus Bathyarchaeota archaeon]